MNVTAWPEAGAEGEKVKAATGGGAFTVTLGLEQEFPDRAINTPIAENGFTGVTYIILLNQYDDAGVTNNWSVQVDFDSSLGQVINTGVSQNPGVLPLVTGQWVPIRIEIDGKKNIGVVYKPR